ncbi:AAA family ATPase [Sphingomonas sp. AR_OL41]|uniref:AAA family ATPase n=1 Tax=Sphingomonas sp. AR_OL41 TaxID=3042729 RepID=UPI00248178B6|nr:AAA family ATPase [Sphingomonas sp. AR_OL41]MDH7972250.1 AAA family ATPase [Sphingomonas sp. AR_OL41]
MNDMTPRKLKGSLVERAAAAYDLDHFLRLPEEPAVTRLPPVAGRAVTPAVHPAPVPARAAVAEDLPFATPRPSTPPVPAAMPAPVPVREGAVSIDRALLAQNGLLVPGAPIGPLAEEFRLIKRHLIGTAATIERAAPAKARTMLVCSAQPNDGKTYCAINLAISLAAERDTEVLLIDADFAKPDILSRLGVPEAPGLLDALADPAAEIERYVIPTDIPQLSLLPAGSKMTGDTELLASRRTGKLIEALLAAAPRRLLLFDSPPALAASPASVLANHAGQVMLVVRADRTSDSDLREAVAMLDGCDHIQLVLNAVSYAPGGRRFGSYYGQEDAK